MVPGRNKKSNIFVLAVPYSHYQLLINNKSSERETTIPSGRKEW
jgi:hypothetical protein